MPEWGPILWPLPFYSDGNWYCSGLSHRDLDRWDGISTAGQLGWNRDTRWHSGARSDEDDVEGDDSRQAQGDINITRCWHSRHQFERIDNWLGADGWNAEMGSGMQGHSSAAGRPETWRQSKHGVSGPLCVRLGLSLSCWLPHEGPMSRGMWFLWC